MRMTRSCRIRRSGLMGKPEWIGAVVVREAARRESPAGRRARLLAASSLLALALGAGDSRPAAAQAGAAPAPTALPEIDVNAAPAASAGYAAQRTSTATKTDTPLRAVPQSVTV